MDGIISSFNFSFTWLCQCSHVEFNELVFITYYSSKEITLIKCIIRNAYYLIVCFFILKIYVFTLSSWSSMKLFLKRRRNKNCAPQNSSEEAIQMYRMFAQFVTRFTTRKSCGKLFERNLTLTSRWIGWLTLSGLPLLAFPPPPPKHFIHGIPGAFPRLCLLFAIPSSLPPSLSCDSLSASVFFSVA